MFASKEWTKSLLNKCFAKRDSYSTSEQKIGTWTDGKTLYRRVLSGYKTGSSTSAVTTIVLLSSLGITNSNVVFYNYYIRTTAGAYIKNGNSGGDFKMHISASGEIQEIHTNSSFNSASIIFIIEYTK